jgi:hypothetical protein
LSNKPRALILGFPLEFQIEIIKKTRVIPVYWCCNKTPDTHLIKNICEWLDNVKAIDRTNYPNEIANILSQNFFDNNSEFFLNNIRSYFDRNDKYRKNISFNEVRRKLYNDTAFWFYIFKKYSIDIVICESYPHMPLDLIAFRLAKICDIPAFFIYQLSEEVFNPFRFIISDDLDDVFGNIKSNTKTIKSEIVSIDSEQKYDGYTLSISLYKSKINIIYQIISGKAIIKFIRKPVKGIKFVIKSFFKYIKIDYYMHLINKIQILLFSQPLPNNHKIVYFPLSAQPEYNSGPMALNYDDLIHTLNNLSNSLPEGWIIALKEHPFQYELVPRNLNFFRQILNKKNIIILSTKTKNDEIFNKVNMVALLGGTTGWEALIAGISTIVFGQIWYVKCRGAVSWKNIDHNQYFNTIERPSKQDIENCLQWIRSVSYPGVFIHQMLDEGLHYLGVGFNENSSMIANSMNSYINSITNK